MTQRETSLVLLLDALGVEATIARFSDRKDFQKMVFLAKCAGVDLGYRYGWYVYGPYAPDLARDYYSLDTTSADEIATVRAKYKLDRRLADRISRAKQAIDSPPPAGLQRSDWLELLASYAFLRRQKRPHDVAVTRLGEAKPHLSGYAEAARSALDASGLLA